MQLLIKLNGDIDIVILTIEQDCFFFLSSLAGIDVSLTPKKAMVIVLPIMSISIESLTTYMYPFNNAKSLKTLSTKFYNNAACKKKNTEQGKRGKG